MAAAREKCIHRIKIPKLSQSLDPPTAPVPIVDAFTAEKRNLVFQQKAVSPYSPVSPAFRSAPAIPVCSLPSAGSEHSYFHQEGKVSIGNLVKASVSLTENESVNPCLNERCSYQSSFVLPRICEPEKLPDSSCSITSDSSSSCKMARAAPCRKNEFCDVTQFAFRGSFKGEMYSCIFPKSFGASQVTKAVSCEKDSKKDAFLNPVKVCSNCSTTVSPNWYLAEDKRPLCNACGKFWKRTGTHRPSCHWGRKIKKRISSSGTKSKRTRQHDNVKERLNMSLASKSTLWDCVGMGKVKAEFGLFETSNDDSFYEQSKRTRSCNDHYSNTLVLMHDEKNRVGLTLPTSKEYEAQSECKASPDINLDGPLFLPALAWKDTNDTSNESNISVDSDVGSSTSFSTKESDARSSQFKYSTHQFMSSTSRKTQLFALEDTLAKNCRGRESSSSKSLIEILAFAASKALETSDLPST